MRKVLLFLCLVVLLTSCGRREYLKAVPSNRINHSGFKYFKWSPDGSKAAVYSSGKLYFISPDGVKLQESMKIDYLQLGNFNWFERNGDWEFGEVNAVQKKNDFNLNLQNGYKEGDEHKANKENAEHPGNFFESIKADNNQRIYLGYTNKYFELVSADIEKNNYKTIVRSTKILCGLNYYNNFVYFLSVDPKNGDNKYFLYKLSGNHFELIDIKNP